MDILNRWFDLDGRGSTVTRELRGAVATFLTMAYILFVNPQILAAAGVPRDSAVACTAAAAGVCCVLMGLYANFPIALASGMGLNAVVAFTLAKQAGSWQVAMGLVVLDGLLILLLVLAGLREAVMHAIPRDLRLSVRRIDRFVKERAGGACGFAASSRIRTAKPQAIPDGPARG